MQRLKLYEKITRLGIQKYNGYPTVVRGQSTYQFEISGSRSASPFDTGWQFDVARMVTTPESRGSHVDLWILDFKVTFLGFHLSSRVVRRSAYGTRPLHLRSCFGHTIEEQQKFRNWHEITRIRRLVIKSSEFSSCDTSLRRW